MDIENLKLILEAVNGVSDGAIYIAILWLGVEYLTAILVAAVIVFAVITAKKLISIVISTSGFISMLQAKIGESGILFDRHRDEIARLVDLGLEVDKSNERR